MNSRDQAGGDRFHVAFDAADLSGEENAGMVLHLQSFAQERWSVDVCVAVNLAVSQETRVFEARDQAKDAGLLAKLEVILKSDEVVGVGAQIFLAELHYGVGHLSGARIFQ